MKSNTSRRDFLKAIVIAPAIPAFTSFINSDRMGESSAIQIKFKVSLNLYSFNKLLSDKEVDLFDMLRFCAQHNFDAIDPTGYYFPGYPTPPPNEFINEFKREAFLLGLDISGTGVRNDFANPDPVARETDIEHIKQWIEVAAKLGSPNLRIFAGTNSHEGFTRDQVFKWMSQDIRKCCDYGKEFGVYGMLNGIENAEEKAQIYNLINQIVETEEELNDLVDAQLENWARDAESVKNAAYILNKGVSVVNPINGFSDVRDVMNTLFSEITSGASTPQTAIETYQSQIDTAIADIATHDYDADMKAIVDKVAEEEAAAAEEEKDKDKTAE